MRQLIRLFCFSLLLSACSGAQKEYYEDGKLESVTILDHSGRQLTKNFTYHENDTIATVELLTDDELTDSIYYAPNGKPELKIRFKKEKKYLQVTYYKDGHEIGFFDPEGDQMKSYTVYDNGKLAKIRFFRKEKKSIYSSLGFWKTGQPDYSPGSAHFVRINQVGDELAFTPVSFREPDKMDSLKILVAKEFIDNVYLTEVIREFKFNKNEQMIFKPESTDLVDGKLNVIVCGYKQDDGYLSTEYFEVQINDIKNPPMNNLAPADF